MACKTTLETIWCIPDDLWDKVRPLLGREKRVGTVGRPCVPHRTCLDGILYVLRTGCQWKRVPTEFGSGSTLHRRFQQWVERGIFKRIWRRLLKEYDALRGIQWRWQAIDSATRKAPLGSEATGKSPVDRGMLGTKRHILTDQRGAPIGPEVTGANRHDSQAVRATLESLPLKRHASGAGGEQHLTADKGYDYPAVRRTIKRRGLVAHIPKRDGQPRKQRGKRRHKPKRDAATAREVIGGAKTSIITTDRYLGYSWLATKRRQVCWAHLRQHFQAIWERGGESQEIGEA